MTTLLPLAFFLGWHDLHQCQLVPWMMCVIVAIVITLRPDREQPAFDFEYLPELSPQWAGNYDHVISHCRWMFWQEMLDVDCDEHCYYIVQPNIDLAIAGIE